MSDSRTSENYPAAFHGASSDPLLELLIEMTDETGAELPITLQVSGLVVSGKLISKSAYFDQFTSHFTQGMTDRQTVEGLRTSFAEISAGPGGDAASPPLAVHMKDAALFGVGNMPVPYEQGALWRGRLSDVDAFFLGEIVLG
jgi:hypothetical protein